MLRQILFEFLIAACFFSSVRAKECEHRLESGLQPGEKIGAFHIIKHAGAENDGVYVGKELCYRCKLGHRPVVVVFAWTVDAQLIALIRKLDRIVADNEKKRIASFCNLLGENKDRLAEEAKRLIRESGAKNIAVVTPVVSPNGPKELKLNEKVDVTVLLYVEGQVKANHAFVKGQLDRRAIDKVVADTRLILE